MKGNTALIAAIKNHFAKPNHNHAILLYGPSGCGKTTLARVVSKEFLGVKDTDIDEINCSDKNGVEDIRNTIEAMKNLPLTGEHNVFIMDECQNLSPAAKSALLKPCEDGADFNYIFFCTTNPDKFFKGDKGEKVSALTTRLTQWKVEPLDKQDAMKLVDEVATKEGIDISDAVFNKIVEVGEGSPRSLLVALESVAGMGSEEEQLKILTNKVMMDSASEDAKDFCIALMGGFAPGQGPDLKKSLDLVKKMKTEGKEDPMSLGKMVMAWATGMLLGKNAGDMKNQRTLHLLSVLQNFDKHFDTNNIDYGWHVLTLAVYEAFF
jgi:DNA polymerase III gamma/tau subunit